MLELSNLFRPRLSDLTNLCIYCIKKILNLKALEFEYFIFLK